jgi:hypothetical protein
LPQRRDREFLEALEPIRPEGLARKCSEPLDKRQGKGRQMLKIARRTRESITAGVILVELAATESDFLPETC